MKKYFCKLLFIFCAFCLISWGEAGHRAVGQIAQKHLTPAAQKAVKELLGRKSLADISTWADEIRSMPQNQYTAGWHFANVPSGLSFSEFSSLVKTMKQDNIYKALLHFIYELQNPSSSRYTRLTALKYIVHFVGDMHQPMHAGHAEDKGGNNIVLSFFGANESLHALWDYGLIEHEGLNYEKMASVDDTCTDEQIKKWQSDDIMIWLWESYLISTILYQEATDNHEFNVDYYNQHIKIIHNRIEKAGVRLAGILNSAFDKGVKIK